MKRTGIHLVAQNKKARHDYEILSTYEAGLVLTGTEIKSIREGRVQLKDGYGKITNGEAFLHEIHISPYPNAGPFNHEPTRTRKLLLHRREIGKLTGKIQEKGLAFVPLRVYLKDGRAKVEMALARGKRKYEKRETLKKQDAKRDIERALRNR
ncbi:MAG: SsrA-binding protein SmpB [bacterium]